MVILTTVRLNNGKNNRLCLKNEIKSKIRIFILLEHKSTYDIKLFQQLFRCPEYFINFWESTEFIVKHQTAYLSDRKQFMLDNTYNHDALNEMVKREETLNDCLYTTVVFYQGNAESFLGNGILSFQQSKIGFQLITGIKSALKRLLYYKKKYEHLNCIQHNGYKDHREQQKKKKKKKKKN